MKAVPVAGPVRDVIVVGAGPAGSNTARLLAARGHDVLMVEEHPQVGRPVQCAGLVTPRVFDHTPFPIGDLHENDLHGGLVYAPDGTTVRFETEAVQAQAMDRAGFDQRMAEHAVRAGVDLRTGTKATGMRRDADGVTLDLLEDGERSTERARLVVGADGLRGGVARWMGLPPVGI